MKKKKLIPKRRFKEFIYDEAWEQRKLGETVNYIVDNRGKNPSYYCDKGIPVIDNYMIKNNCYPNLNEASRFIDDEIYENFIRKYNEFDDTLITLVGNGIGNVTMFPKTKSVIIQNTLGLRFNENKKFMFYLMLFKNKEILLLNRGMAQPNIRQDELLDINIKLPVLDEQNKISDFFFKLDNLITLHQRKLKKLKEIKSAYLSEMFPREGEKYPKRRFDGFTDPWEQCKLDEIISKFIVPMRDKPKEFSGNIPWTRIEDIEGNYINGTLSGQYVSIDTIQKMNLKIIPKGSLIVSASATFGIVAMVTADLITNQTFIGLVPNKDNDLDFLYVLFKSNDAQEYMKAQSAGSTIFYIARESFENMIVKVPKIEEQKKVGEFFKHLDNLIILHQEKLEKLENLKKAYLNEMFI